MAKKEEKGPKRGGDDAVIGRGANPGGGAITKICKKLNVDDETAAKLLSEARGDYVQVLKNANMFMKS